MNNRIYIDSSSIYRIFIQPLWYDYDNRTFFDIEISELFGSKPGSWGFLVDDDDEAPAQFYANGEYIRPLRPVQVNI